MTRRRFNGGERVDLYIKADGKCSTPGCNNNLEPGWHADHVVAYTNGGPTVIENGQALCPPCNLKKGSKQVQQRRDWQERFYIDYWKRYREGQLDYLLHAGPGSGKTRAAAEVAAEQLQAGCQRIIVVCPNRSIKRATVKTYNKFGVRITGRFNNADGGIRDDLVGAVVTYHQVTSRPDLFKNWCSRFRTFVILDEVHHAADEANWGSAIEEAFSNAVARLMLTGTPFRSDSKQIKWVNYVNVPRSTQVECKPDFSYGFGEASADKVVLELIFHLLDGEGNWIEDGESRKAGFWDAAQYKRRRAKTAAMRRGSWKPTAFSAAVDLLESIRKNGHAHAGLLVMVDSIRDAEATAAALEILLGKGQVLKATSDETDALETIEKFKGTEEKEWRDGQGKALVFVGMVSEGTDIPRAAVGVHASTVEAPVKCMQFWTRVVRLCGGMTKAHVFIPNTEELEKQARAVFEDQMKHRVETEKDDSIRCGPGQREESTVTYVDSSEASLFGVIAQDGDFNGELLDRAQHAMSVVPEHVQNIDVIDIVRIIQHSESYAKPIPAGDPDDHRKRRQDHANYLVRRIAIKTREEHGAIWGRHGIGGGRKLKLINNRLLEDVIRSLEVEWADVDGRAS